MKKIILFSTFFAAALFIIGCTNDDDLPIEPTTNIEINFTGSYNNEPLQMQKEYVYGDGKAIKFVQYDFYVSDIVLIKESSADSPVTDLKEVDFVDLSFTGEQDAINGQTIKVSNIPVGEYAGIRFGLGVSPELNRTKPEDYGEESPLRDHPDHYWSGWNSFIFSKIEAFADLNNNDTIAHGGANSEGMSFHMGTDEAYKEITRYEEIILTEDATGTIKLQLDLSKAFDIANPLYDANGDGFLDIETFHTTHSDAELDIAKRILENVGDSFTLEF